MHLHTLHLYTRNLDALYQFYSQQLQCRVKKERDTVNINAGATELVFHLATSGDPNYHFAFSIPWNQVQEALAWTEERIPLLELEPGQHLADFRNWKAKAFYFMDPAGNIVECIAREPLNIRSELPFSGASFASVSEIGIVTDDVTLACRQLNELWSVPLFDRQPPTPNFAASGDDHGLFIVVKEGRNWYPTQQPAIKAPLTAVYATQDGVVRTLNIT